MLCKIFFGSSEASRRSIVGSGVCHFLIGHMKRDLASRVESSTAMERDAKRPACENPSPMAPQPGQEDGAAITNQRGSRSFSADPSTTAIANQRGSRSFGADPSTTNHAGLASSPTTETREMVLPVAHGDAAAGPRPESDFYQWEVVASPVRNQLRRSQQIRDETWLAVDDL